jgi:hypothetical protein
MSELETPLSDFDQSTEFENEGAEQMYEDAGLESQGEANHDDVEHFLHEFSMEVVRSLGRFSDVSSNVRDRSKA